jgi:microcystin-dependent protein
MLCEGQILPIAQNQAVFSLLGTTYGGDGMTTFALPDLRGRVPVHSDSTLLLGQAQGEASHTLTTNEIAAHTHLASGSTNPVSEISPQNNVWGTQNNLYGPEAALALMNGAAISNSGGNLPHSNMQPYLTLNFCIALVGIFPSRN